LLPGRGCRIPGLETAQHKNETAELTVARTPRLECSKLALAVWYMIKELPMPKMTASMIMEQGQCGPMYAVRPKHRSKRILPIFAGASGPPVK